MVKFTIPGEPMAKQRPKHGNGNTYTPDKTVNYETFIKEIYISGSNNRFDGEIEINVKAYFKIPKSESKKRKKAMEMQEIRPTKKPDGDNILKIICDALNNIAYHDDSHIVKATVEKLYSEIPRVEVILKELRTKEGE